jgi:hypothetical protein
MARLSGWATWVIAAMGSAAACTPLATIGPGSDRVASPSPRPTMSPSVSPTPSASPSPLISAGNLNGTWTVYTVSDVAAGPQPRCTNGNILITETWNFVQQGNTLTDDYVYLSPGGAYRCDQYTEHTTGTVDNGRVVLNGNAGRKDVCSGASAAPSSLPMAYDLRFNAATGHLEGTRNGQPVWLAPVRFPTNEWQECGPPRP